MKKHGELIMLILYDNNRLGVCKNKAFRDEVISYVNSKRDIKILENVIWVLGMTLFKMTMKLLLIKKIY
jgi:hypothetical protein